MPPCLKNKTLWYICSLLLMGTLLIPRTSLSREEDSGGINTASSATESYIHKSINQIRKEYHLPPLKTVPALQQFARDHSRYMAKSGYLGHNESGGIDFRSRIEKARLKGWRVVGENVGRSQGYRNNADTIISGWMESKPHRENILTAGFTMTGIGTAEAKDGTLYATQVFMGSDDQYHDSTR
ncbi:MAG: CAP domain-containing protein [Geobacteraceae bacterium]|nr:CAP domain-containing protein [Geobacteraceae bacterium]